MFVVVVGTKQRTKTASRKRQLKVCLKGPVTRGYFLLGLLLKREIIVGSCNFSIDLYKASE